MTTPTNNDSLSQPTAGCLFSGMGGFATGLKKSGFKIEWANDDNQFAAATFRHRFPDAKFVEKDVRNLSVEEDCLPAVDVLVGGFPCQSFSIAGEKKGFNDPRGELFFEIPRIVKEYADERCPKFIILENVEYLLKGGSSSWFNNIQQELRNAGYWFREDSCWVVNVMDATNLPQDRTRVFMVAASRDYFSKNPFSKSKIRHRKASKKRTILDIIDRKNQGEEKLYLDPNNKYYKMIDAKIETGESEQNIYQLRRSYVREKKDLLCPTLTANMGGGGHNVPFIKDDWGIRKLSTDEVASLQGFDVRKKLFPEIPDNEKYRLVGNSACPHLVKKIADICLDALKELNNG